MSQQSHFPEKDMKPNSIKLEIRKSKNKNLNPEQTTFNRFSKRIETLRGKIRENQTRLDKILAFYSEKIPPGEESFGRMLFQFVKVLYRCLKEEKLTQINKEALHGLILNNLHEAFKYTEPDEEIREIYDFLSPVSFADQEANEIKMTQDMMEQFLRDEFGMDVDFSGMDMSDESMAKKMAELKDEFEARQLKEQDRRNQKKKSKKEIEAEFKKRETEEFQKKNIRSVYYSLAKMLHPDLETDENLKLEREELMKKVTGAYKAKDLHTLLKLEIEIIHKQNSNLDHLTDEKLKFLNSALKDQVQELEIELDRLGIHPRYSPIEPFIDLPEHTAYKFINERLNDLVLTEMEIKEDVAKLSGKTRLPFLKSILKSVRENVFEEDPFDDNNNNFEALANSLAEFERLERKRKKDSSSKTKNKRGS